MNIFNLNIYHFDNKVQLKYSIYFCILFLYLAKVFSKQVSVGGENVDINLNINMNDNDDGNINEPDMQEIDSNEAGGSSTVGVSKGIVDTKP